MLAAFLIVLATTVTGHAPRHARSHPQGHHKKSRVTRRAKPKVKVIAKPPVKPVPPPPPPFDPTAPIFLKPPRSRFGNETPLPGAPPIIMDRKMSGGGIANAVAKSRGLQGRIIWIDGTANIEKINDEEKIVELVRKIHEGGFNTIVWDGKPIAGQTLYPSRIAPRMLQWRAAQMPQDFDPLKILVREAKRQGLLLYVSLNAFSEGHQLLKVGPGYDKPDQQTVLYEPRVILKSAMGSVFPCNGEPNVMPQDASQIGIFTDPAKLPKFPIEGVFAVSLAPRNKVIDGFDNGGVGSNVPTLPKGGAVLVGRGLAADFLRRNAQPGQVLAYGAVPNLVPIGKRPNRQIPLMMNPNDQRVQNYALDIVRELATNYDIDGILYDDRLRYAGLDADFSQASEEDFESFVGHKVDWPESVYTYSISTNLTKGYVPGPEWDAWIAFRTLTIRNYLARVRGALKATRPTAQLGVYTGSWYGEYYNLGSNWASPKFDAGFWFLTPEYQKTGFAPLIDFLITGCYYKTATIHQAMAQGEGLGSCIEAGGALTNRAVRDETWCFAGISLIDFKDDPKGLMNALSAACGTTQGVMVFDLSHNIDPMWPVFAQAFSSHVRPPQSDPAALAGIRKQREAVDKTGAKEPPVIILSGTNGAGQ